MGGLFHNLRHPRRCYVVCAIPRSGSNLLTDGLHATRRAGRPKQFFLAGFEARRASDVDRGIARARRGCQPRTGEPEKIESARRYFRPGRERPWAESLTMLVGRDVSRLERSAGGNGIRAVGENHLFVREIDRRLVYIDPHPVPAVLPRQHVVPGFFAMLRGALSDIPSSQPVIDELTRVIEFNEQVRRLRAIVDSARPHINQLVGKVVTTTFDRPISSEELRAWREQVNSHVARDAGFAYQAYVRLKLASVRAFGAELIVKLRGVPAQSPLSRVVSEIIDAWALHKGIVYERADSEVLEFESQTAEHLPAWVKYLLAFDVKYRVRRMHFLITGQNRLYQLIDEDRFAGLDPLVIDQLKREFYGRLDALRRREDAGFYSREVRELAADIFPAAPSGAEVRHLEAYAASFVEQHIAKLDRLIEQLAVEIDLNASTREIDDLLASLDRPSGIRRHAGRYLSIILAFRSGTC